MTHRADVASFISEKKIALVGISRSGKGFGHVIFKELLKKSYEILPVHPAMSEINNHICYPSVCDLPGGINALIICAPPEQTERVVREAAETSIKKIWMQQGAASEAAIDACKRNNITVIHDECILMFAEPVAFFHRLHRGIRKFAGKLPA